jgi:hypothetical protein
LIVGIIEAITLSPRITAALTRQMFYRFALNVMPSLAWLHLAAHPS